MFQVNLRETLLSLPAILFGLSIHEFAHSYLAKRLGDDTSARQGRLTLNPIVHIDLIGFLLLIFAGFGWAKPVQVNPQVFKNPKRDDILVSIAGPLANLAAAIAFAVIIKLIIMFASEIFLIKAYGKYIFRILIYFVWINLILFLFNLVPIPPLDGSHLLFAFLTDRFRYLKELFFRFGSIALLIIILLEKQTGQDILPIGKMTVAIYNGLFSLLGIR